VLTLENAKKLLKSLCTTSKLRSALLLLMVPAACWGQNPCPRHPLGSAVADPPAVFSNGGKLTVDLTYLLEHEDGGMMATIRVLPKKK